MVTNICLDKGILGKHPCSYTPDTRFLNQKINQWDRIKFDGSYGYAQDSSSGHRGICEVYNGYTYASLNSHVAKISSDGSYEYLS